MKILLTGFEIFQAVDVNPSEEIVRYLAQNVAAYYDYVDLICEVLPVVYQSAEQRVRDLIDEHHPQAILMLGVAQNRDAINIERFAINLDDASIPDNAGELREGQSISDYAPEAYRSTLPIYAMQEGLRQAHVPVKISNHAGAYLCNHVFYVARYHSELCRRPVPCGFIHLPAIGDEAPNMSLEAMINAVVICLDLTIRSALHGYM